ncbi:MAG TPA: ABC transporter substrate-binding protein [Candidatus Limnocylindrales bacterium]|nr:ABC transporter substrate-binding protein [Candidatus Limnocylindrales bacterium]
MPSRSLRLAATLGAAVILAACGGATPSPSSAPSSPPSGTPAPTQAASTAPSPVANLPATELLFPGKLVVCSDLPYEPFEYYDAQGNPIGSDIEIAQGIATRLGLTAQIQNSVFDTIIAAVTSGKCDIIVSDQNITPDRLSQVDMIPYQQVTQAMAILKGNPAGINTELDACGKKIGSESGTTEQGYLEGADLYKQSGGLKKKCTDAGKPAPKSVTFQKDSDAFAALAAHQVDAYFADGPVVDTYVAKAPDQFEKANISIPAIKVGISVPKPSDAHKATSSGHTALADAVTAALISMINDGSYLAIMQKYKVDAGAIQASDVVINKYQ